MRLPPEQQEAWKRVRGYDSIDRKEQEKKIPEAQRMFLPL
jgi:hypothetical protein